MAHGVERDERHINKMRRSPI